MSQEASKTDLQRTIEIGVARYWPDFQRIAEYAGVTISQVHDAVDMMDLEEPEPRRETGLTEAQMIAARRAYDRLNSKGIKAADMPAWVRDGRNAYTRSKNPCETWVPFEPLRRYVESITRKHAWRPGGNNNDFLSQRGWVSGTWQAKAWDRARRCGRLTTTTADQLACDLGVHPSEIWGEEWWSGEKRIA